MTQKKSNYPINPKDVEGSKLLVLLVISFVYIFVLMSLYKFIINTQTILTGFLGIQIQFYVSIAFLIAAIVFFVLRKTKKIDEKLKVITSKNTLLTAIVFFIASSMILKYDVYAIKIMYVVVPVWFVLYLIYTSYVREFFFISLSCTIASILLYICDRIVSTRVANALIAGSITYVFGILNTFYIPVVILLLLVGIALLLVIRKTQKSGGIYKVSKSSFKLASIHAKWSLMYISVIIPMLFLTVSLFLYQILMFGIYTIAAYFVLMVIFYTYKLMNK